MALRTAPRLRYERGFTLVEMMTVVIIVGVLAGLAVYGVRKYISSSKVSEAVSMMTSIKAGEEAFKGETFIYLDVSGTFDPTNFYPKAPSSQGAKVQWGGAGTGIDKWKTLGVSPDGPTAFQYAVVATAPNSAQPTLPTAKSAADFKLPSTTAGWQYIAVAKADLGGKGGVYTYVLSHSYSSEVYVENEGE
jgi:type IV pilus assembly protein PilA